jgi:hypothetical protein
MKRNNNEDVISSRCQFALNHARPRLKHNFRIPVIQPESQGAEKFQLPG